MEFNIQNIMEMKDLGNKIGRSLKGGEVICLVGDLGAGKTHLTKFIGEGMGIDEYITSPTFAILNIYEGKIHLNHFDMYRLEEDVEFEDLGFDDYLFSDDVNIIEWPERIKKYLPKTLINIEIKTLGEEKRQVNITTNYDEKYKYILESLKW